MHTNESLPSYAELVTPGKKDDFSKLAWPDFLHFLCRIAMAFGNRANSLTKTEALLAHGIYCAWVVPDDLLWTGISYNETVNRVCMHQ